MCRVKCGEDILSEGDLQNVVVGILLRQQNQYREEEIVDAVLYHCKGSPWTKRPIDVKRLVRDNIDFLSRNGWVTRMNGIHTPVLDEELL